MEPNTEMEKVNEAPQKSVYATASKVLEGQIERPFARTEKKALGFVFDRKWKNETTSPSFFQEIGVNEADKGNELEWKLRGVVHSESMEEIKRRMEKNADNSVELGRLQAIRELINTGQNYAVQAREANPQSQVYIGGVPGDWAPEWLNA